MADVGIKIKATDEATGVFGKVAAEAGKLQGAVAGVGSSFAALGTVAVAGLSVVSFASQVKQAIDLADSFNKLSQKTGIAVEELSKLNYAAGLADVSTESLAAGMRKLNVSIAEAAGGNASKIATFQALGVSFKDAAGQALSADKVFSQLSDVMSKSADSAEKVNVGSDLMGKGFQDLIPLANAGAKGLESMGDEAKKLGIVMSADFAKNAEEFNDNLHKISLAGEGLFVTLAGDLVKGLGKVASAMAEAAIEGGKFAAVMAGVQTLLTGDDQHKNNVDLVEQTEKMLSIEQNIAMLRSQGHKDTSGMILMQKRQLAEVNAELKTTMAYRKVLQEMEADKAKAQTPKPSAVSDPLKRANAGLADTAKAPRETGNAFAAEQDAAKEWGKAWETATKTREDLIAKNLGLSKSEEDLKKYMESSAAAINEKTNPAMNQMIKDRLEANIALEASIKLADMIEAQQKRTSNAEDETQKERERVAAIGLTTEAVAELNATRLEELATVKERDLLSNKEIANSADYTDAVKGEIKALRERANLARTGAQKEAAVEAAKAATAEWKRGWEQTDNLAREAFADWVEDGSSAAKKIGDTLKKALLAAIYEATLKPVVFNIYSSLTGGGAGAGAGGIGGAAGSAFNTAKNGYSIYSSGSSAYSMYQSGASASDSFMGLFDGGAAARGTMEAGTNFVGPSSTLAGEGTAASSGTFSSLGIAGMILYGMHLLDTRGGGYVKATGSADSNFNSTGMITGGSGAVGNYAATRSTTAVGPDGVSHTTTMPVEIGSPSTDNTFAKNMVRDANAAYLNATKLLGIKAVDSHFTYDSNSSDGGKFALTADAGGKSFNSGEVALNDNALKLAAGRAVITALQGSELPKWMAGVFDNLNASTLDQAGVDATITHAGQLREAFTALSTIPNVDLAGISFETLDSMKGMATELAAVDIAFSALGYKLFDISAAGAAAAQGLAQAFGGLQSFQAQTAALFQNYYTPAEQRQQTYQSVADQLKAAGITGITTADIAGATREQIRTVVDTYAAKVGTTEGDRQYAAIVAGANTLSPYVAGFADPNKKPDAPYQERGSSGGGGAPVQDAALSAWQDATDAIIKTMSDLRTTLVDSGPDSYAKLQAQFAIEAASAKAGNLSSAQDLPALAKALVDAGKSYNTSSVAQALLTARVLDTLGSVAGVGSAGANLSIPKFAAGGFHSGGWALVGEQGPELVNMPSARVFNARDTRAMLGGGTDPAVLEKLSAIERELSAIRAAAGATAVNTGKSAKVLDAATKGGQPLATTAV